MSSSTSTEVFIKEDIKIQIPKLYKVVIYNDNRTTIDFVIELLQSVFRKTLKESLDITMSVHETGSGLAGIYTKEIAEDKTVESINLARTCGFPLIVEYEPE